MGNEGHRTAAVIHLEGNFDVPAARLLQNSLKGLGGDTPIRVDFTRVRQFNDFAVAILAQALVAPGAGTVRLVGLRLHQVRMLRYFGVSPDVFRLEE